MGSGEKSSSMPSDVLITSGSSVIQTAPDVKIPASGRDVATPTTASGPLTSTPPSPPGVSTSRRPTPPSSLPIGRRSTTENWSTESPITLQSILTTISQQQQQQQQQPLQRCQFNAGLPFFPMGSPSPGYDNAAGVGPIDVGIQVASLETPVDLLSYASQLTQAHAGGDGNSDKLEEAVEFLRKFAEHVCASSKRTTPDSPANDTTSSSNPELTQDASKQDGCGKAAGIRPKSFLREEMDEFDRIFSELLSFSPQQRISECPSEDDPIGGNKTGLAEQNVRYSGANVNMECAQCKRFIGSRSCGHESSVTVRGADDSSRCLCRCGRSIAGSEHPVSGPVAGEQHAGVDETPDGSEQDRSRRLEAWHKTLWDENDRLFFQLLDDLDNLTGDTPSARRRKKAREMFSNWLFSDDTKSPEHPAKTYKDAFRDLARSRSADAPDGRAALFSRWRPRSFEYHSEDDNDSGYHTGSSTLKSRGQKPVKKSPGQWTLTREELRRNIEIFNNNNHGLIMSLQPDTNTFQGFIRVHMNLIRPINMSLSTRPPSIYDVIGQGDDEEGGDDDSQITSFYLPKDTTKVIHINSNTTTQEVIKALLSKFKITDNPRKFALYEKIIDGDKATMRRLEDDEMPLPLCLCWTKDGVNGLDKRKFVLQENDTGEIMWEAFSLPELENFLKILNREEEEYVEQVRCKYRMLKIHMERRLKELCPSETTITDDKRTPVFV